MQLFKKQTIKLKCTIHLPSKCVRYHNGLCPATNKADRNRTLLSIRTLQHLRSDIFILSAWPLSGPWPGFGKITRPCGVEPPVYNLPDFVNKP